MHQALFSTLDDRVFRVNLSSLFPDTFPRDPKFLSYREREKRAKRRNPNSKSSYLIERTASNRFRNRREEAAGTKNRLAPSKRDRLIDFELTFERKGCRGREAEIFAG